MPWLPCSFDYLSPEVVRRCNPEIKLWSTGGNVFQASHHVRYLSPIYAGPTGMEIVSGHGDSFRIPAAVITKRW
jgi:hypothetical protein